MSGAPSDNPAEVTTPVGTPGRRSPPKVAIGQQLGRYVVLEVLGKGAMGEVLRAYDPKLRRELAVKRIVPSTLTSAAEARLVREAQAMAQLGHPNVVAVYDVDVTEHGVLVAMEYVRGTTLQRWLRKEPPWAEIVRCFVQAGRGLQAAHEAGLVHRDFKPANVLVAEDGRVRVADFGLVKVAEPGRSGMERSLGDASVDSTSSLSTSLENVDAELTGADVVLGTPMYMAPEQHTGPAGPAADQFAFCVALWEALTGDVPYRARSLAELARSKWKGPPPWPRDATKIPRRILAAVVRGLAPEAKDRFVSMEALVAELDRDASMRRRNLGLVVGGVAVGSVALVVVAVQAGEAVKCAGAQAQIEEAWGPARRDEVAQAFTATGSGAAEAAFATAAERLDRFTEGWAAHHRDACEATALRGEQSEAVLDLRMGCLGRARGELAAIVGVFAQADATTVERSHRLLEGLPELDRCDDVAALQQEVEPPPAGPVADAVAAARQDLARSRALYRTGRYEESLALAEEVEARTRDLDYPPIHAEVALGRGDVLDYLGRYDECEAALEDALQLALREGAYDTAIKAATSLVYVVGNYLGRPEEAQWPAHVALDLAIGTDADPVTEARARNAMGNAYRIISRWDESEAVYREGIRRLGEAVGERDSRVATLIGALGAVLTEAGRYDRAEPELLRAYELRRSLLGPHHPDTANSGSSYGFILFALGRFEEAETVHREALEARLQAHGSNHFFTARARGEVAWDLTKLGRAEEALPELDAAMAGLKASLPDDHPGYLEVLLAHAYTLQRLGRLDEAEARSREALRIGEKAYGAEFHLVGETTFRLAEVLVRQGRTEEAVELGRRAVAVLEKARGSDHLMTMRARAVLGEALVEAGQSDTALPLLEVSWGFHESAPVSKDWRARVAFVLARALADTSRARKLATQAEADFAAAGPGFAPDRAGVARWLSTSAKDEGT